MKLGPLEPIHTSQVHGSAFNTHAVLSQPIKFEWVA